MASGAEPVYEELLRLHEQLGAVPEHLHFFCPKANDDDLEDYSDTSHAGETVTLEEKLRRIEEAEKRMHSAYWFSLILGIKKDQAAHWLPEWVERTERDLMRCDVCVRNWQMKRKPFLKKLVEQFDDETVNIMEAKLNEFDKIRIDRGLRKAAEILRQHGAMNTAKLALLDETAVLALYEALCCMPYLSLPENREHFNFVFQKTQERKPLRLGAAVIPTMTFFLFQEDPVRNRFARAAWERLEPQSLTTQQFDWAVNQYLANAITNVTQEGISPTQIKLFWEGVLLLLNAMPESLILHSLQGDDYPTDIFHLAVMHLHHNSDEVLYLVLKVLRVLLTRSPTAFWQSLSEMPRMQLAEELFKSPAFRPLLRRSLEYNMLVEDGQAKVPFLPLWIKDYLNSLKPNERTDVCSSLLLQFFEVFRLDASLTREGQTTCTLAGLHALSLTMDGFLDEQYYVRPGLGFVIVGTALDLAIKYKDIIIASAELRAEDRYNVGLSQAAMSVIQSALSLDTKTTRAEWVQLHSKKEGRSAPRAAARNSSQLWDSFLDMLSLPWPGKVELARIMLLAMTSLNGVEKFPPPKHEPLTDESQKGFNEDFGKCTEVVGRVLERLSDFDIADLRSFCSDTQARTLHPIVASIFHGEAPIREAGTSLLKTITGEDRRSDAIVKMLEDYFHGFLLAFCDVVKATTYGSDTSYHPYSPMPHILVCSRDILNGLCDTTVGLLRSRTLSGVDVTAIKSWWTAQWECLQHAFNTTRAWSLEYERSMLEEFCRDAMELATQLLAQDGVVASALGGQGRALDQSHGDATSRALKTVLELPRLNAKGMADMLRLRDKYLVSVIVGILCKLLRRLTEFDMTLEEDTVAYIRQACEKKADGKYKANTNLNDQQRAELLKALGDDTDVDSVEIIALKTRAMPSEKPKKQSTIDQWSRSGTTTPGSSSTTASLPTRTNRDDVLDLSSNLDRYRASELAKVRPKESSIKPKPVPRLDAKAMAASQASLREARQKEKADKAKRDAEAIAKAKALRAPKIVPGEGSGMRGIAGVTGKEHGPHKKSEMMVDSSSEDDDSDSEDDIATSRNARKPGSGVLDPHRRRRELELLQKTRGPVKKEKVVRSAKDMRARLIPPMEVLHNAILEWDIFHEGNDPPNGYACAAVADAYLNPSRYKETFFPLLVNEAWRSFVTAKDENTSKSFGIRVVNRMSVDKFLEVTTSMPAVANKDRGLSEGDIVLLSKSSDPLANKDAPHCLARIWKTTYKKNNLEVAYRLNGRNNPILPELLPGAEFQAVKITNMTTIEREYAALESLQYYDLMDEVLKAEPSPILKFGEEAVKNVMQNYFLNPGQAKAILNAKENDGFTLVQGPPGTGKTKTIVAMVGALLTGHINNKSAAVPIKRPPGAHQNGQQAPSKKLLVCAPSNAAVDELVLRLKQGVKTMNGSFHKIEVLRLGRSDAINAAVKDVTLDERVKAEMEVEINKNGGKPSDREKMHEEAGEIKVKVNELRPQLEAARAGEDRALTMKLQREFDELKRRQAHIGAKIDADKDSGNTYAREAEIRRRQVQQRILDSAQVLCATLSGSGHEMFKNLNVEFETVIIDEAAQCVELSALIPLKYGCSKCILVGDPKQLPPTVLSQSAARFGYDQSLFVRMQHNHPDDVHLLDTQYRMHPDISLFPSREFYEGRLIDGGDMLKTRRQPWHDSSLLGPYRFFDVEGVQERGHRGQSLVNVKELEVAMHLYNRFRTDYSKLDLKGKIGIITPYKAQLFALRQRFTDRYGDAITEEIEFNTTDAFQGRECEIIIFSCVRASSTGGIGFMTDIRRMNVGLTRAKSSLWILGDSRALVQGEFWAKLIDDAKRRDRYTKGNILAMLRKPGQDKSRSSTPYTAAPSPAPSVSSAPTDKEDIDMIDAPPISRQQQTPPVVKPEKSAQVSPGNLNSQYGMPPRIPQPTASIGGFNERGEAMPITPRSMEKPQIQNSSLTEAASKKRSLEGGEEEKPPPKRTSNSMTSTRPIPTGPKAINPPKPMKKVTDPSAMEVLGLVPPKRPQPIMNSANVPAPRPPVRPGPPANAPKGPMAAKKKADPFIKKKPPPKR